MGLPKLEEIIHSLHQDPKLISPIDEFSVVLGDMWNQSWLKEELIFRVNDPEGLKLPVYSSDEVESAGSISGSTPDTLAFYISYHYSRQRWGIYLLRSGVLKLAKHLVSRGLGYLEAIEISRMFLIRHELTHFQTDFGITGLELSIRKPIYLKFRDEIRLKSPGWNLIEEGLANRLGKK